MKIQHTFFYFFFLLIFLPGYFFAYGQLNADFSASSTTGCTPFNVQFKDLSSGNPASWFWDFGNGITSTSQNPVASYTVKGAYAVRLIIKNPAGQTYIEKKNYILVSATPDASFSLDKSSGCLPLPVNFTNNTNSFGEGIKSWLWDFGDGSVSNQQAPSYAYNVRGRYDVTLVVQNVAGCIDSFKLADAVRTGVAPANVSFKANPLDGCASAPRNFTDLSSGTINTWTWDFGDGGTSNSQNPSYHYTDTGWFSVKLKVSDNGCADSVQYNRYMHIVAPIAAIVTRVDCSNPHDVNFIALQKGAQTWDWSFGDGGTSALKQILHTYKTPGIYTVKLKVSAGACIDSIDYIMNIIDQKPSYEIIPPKASFCKNDSIQFLATNYDSSKILYSAWSLDGGITRTAYRSNFFTIKNAYSTVGNNPSPIFYIINKEKCYDTIQKAPIVITGSTAGFTNSFPVCIGNKIGFSDQSVLYQNSAVKQWKWNFGDGDSVITSSTPISYKYPFPGLYNVLLKITDTDGCTDTVSHVIDVSDTPVINAGNDTFICAGKSVTLQPSGGSSYTWANNAYLNCTSCSNPVANPVDTTVFYVTGTNAAGCSSADSIKINVQQQQTVTAEPTTDTICTGDSVQLFASGSDLYKWQPANGLNNPNIPNPLATPSATTIYTVTGTDKAGCFSNTASTNIVAYPKPVIDIKDSIVTVQPGAAYQLQTTNSADIIKWQWQPAQWLSDPNIANPVAQPQETTTYTVIGATAGGCVSRDQITITVLCNNSVLFVPNTFSPNNDGMNDYFYPRSSAAINIKALKIFNRWGQEIFKQSNFLSNNQSAGWDGRFKGTPQQSDVYMYIINVICSNGSVFSTKGSITLIR